MTSTLGRIPRGSVISDRDRKDLVEINRPLASFARSIHLLRRSESIKYICDEHGRDRSKEDFATKTTDCNNVRFWQGYEFLVLEAAGRMGGAEEGKGGEDTTLTYSP
jgi:hypothetical protein